ncbi:MAG: Na+/H+ antiporter subunit E [Alphaproteobacteria bacterium]|nr:Na+/H+ antiporter subunit E [Alphaproteobacteria bacterium]
MTHYFISVLILSAFWLVNSGHYTALLLGLGAGSVVLVVFLSHRMDVAEPEDTPLSLNWGIFGYWIWLIWEIWKSNIDVARIVLDPRLPISPTVFTVTGLQRSAIGKVVFANSITLTPGTVTIDIEGDRFCIHALTRDGAKALQEGEMNRRAARLER